MDPPGSSINSDTIQSFLNQQARRDCSKKLPVGEERPGRHGRCFWQALASGSVVILKTAVVVGVGVAAVMLTKSKVKDIMDQEASEGQTWWGIYSSIL